MKSGLMHVIYSTPCLFGATYIMLTIQDIAFASDKNKPNILRFLIAMDSRSFPPDSKASTFPSHMLNDRSPLCSSKCPSSGEGGQDAHEYQNSDSPVNPSFACHVPLELSSIEEGPAVAPASVLAAQDSGAAYTTSTLRYGVNAGHFLYYS